MSQTVISHMHIVYGHAARFASPTLAKEHRQLAGPVQCPQVASTMDRISLEGIISQEDCLTLNVFAPENADHLPVLVWIHGGGFVNGTGNSTWYDGSKLAQRGCVVVVINYRLGVFGFAGAADLGLQDQIVALQWVQENIQRYGGDSTNVSIFGESAGGTCVVALYAAPAAQSLFVRGWALSASLGQLRSSERANEALATLLQALGESSLDGLANRPMDELVAAQREFWKEDDLRQLDVATSIEEFAKTSTFFAPTIGGDVVAADAEQRIANDARPLIISTTRDEMNFWMINNPSYATMTEVEARKHFAAWFGDEENTAWHTYAALRPGASPGQMVMALNTDRGFRSPAWRIIDDRDRAGSPTWSTFFTWPSPVFGGVLGACHALDIPFVFDNVDLPLIDIFIGSPQEHGVAHRHLADTLAGALVEFATTGRVTWQPTSGNRTTLRLDETNETWVDPERPLYDLWSRLSDSSKP